MATFSQQWRQDSPKRRMSDTADVWDERITEDPTRFGPEEYSEDFLALAQLLPGESVFDMGCGAGTLAIPCAEKGHRVLAADFSQGMLNQLAANVESNYPECSSLIETKNLSWTDDWVTKGVLPKSFDVAFASRSIITRDLEDSLKKLSNTAKRKVCVTAVTGDSPRVFGKMLRDLGLTSMGHDDAKFVTEVVKELGYEPIISSLPSRRKDCFRSKEEAFQKYQPMLNLTQTPIKPKEMPLYEEKLKSWIDQHLIPNETESGTLFIPDVTRVVPWAFISWLV